jgi:hypothetical protein
MTSLLDQLAVWSSGRDALRLKDAAADAAARANKTSSGAAATVSPSDSAIPNKLLSLESLLDEFSSTMARGARLEAVLRSTDERAEFVERQKYDIVVDEIERAITRLRAAAADDEDDDGERRRHDQQQTAEDVMRAEIASLKQNAASCVAETDELRAAAAAERERRETISRDWMSARGESR